MSALMHDPRAAHLSDRVCKVLTRNGINSWDALVREATRTPNMVRSLRGVGGDAVNQIIAVLEAAKVDHTITKFGPRGSAAPRR